MTKRTEIQKSIETYLPRFPVTTVFDVGANTGQSTSLFLSQFPYASIWSFEPARPSFELLQTTFALERRVKVFPFAFGVADGKALMKVKGVSTGNRIVAGDRPGTVPVEIKRGDDFCKTTGINTINFLKVDTEGHDLDVLVGFRKMIADQRIDMIQVEAGMNCRNLLHVPFERFKGFLEPLGYFIFRIVEQAAEMHGRPNLRRCNLVFISDTLIENNIRAKSSISTSSFLRST